MRRKDNLVTIPYITVLLIKIMRGISMFFIIVLLVENTCQWLALINSNELASPRVHNLYGCKKRSYSQVDMFYVNSFIG